MKTLEPVTMQQRFDWDRDDYLTQCRDTARRLLRFRSAITIEDVVALCPKPAYLHRNILGSVFDNQFEPVDFVKARHTKAKGRYIRTWRLRHG